MEGFYLKEFRTRKAEGRGDPEGPGAGGGSGGGRGSGGAGEPEVSGSGGVGEPEVSGSGGGGGPEVSGVRRRRGPNDGCGSSGYRLAGVSEEGRRWSGGREGSKGREARGEQRRREMRAVRGLGRGGRRLPPAADERFCGPSGRLEC